MFWTSLPNRGVICFSGKDRKTFLQGLITQDVFKLSQEQALYGAFLTPQGRYLYDFFLLEHEERLYIECERDILDAFLKRLKIYKLRLDVTFEDVSAQFKSVAVLDAPAVHHGAHHVPLFGLSPRQGHLRTIGKSLVFVDPRLSDLGLRLLLADKEALKTAPPIPEAPFSTYDTRRIALGIPDGRRDLIPEKSIPLENGFEELMGIDWKKGCYLGQELTARTHYQGLIRKRLLPLHLTGPSPCFGAPLFYHGEKVGEMRSSCNANGLALVRLEAFFACQEKGDSLQTQDPQSHLRPYLLPWMRVCDPSSWVDTNSQKAPGNK